MKMNCPIIYRVKATLTEAFQKGCVVFEQINQENLREKNRNTIMFQTLPVCGAIDHIDSGSHHNESYGIKEL